MAVQVRGATYLDELAEWLTATRFEDLPEDVVRHTERVIADTVGVVIAGGNEAECGRLAERLIGLSGAGTATVLRVGFPTTDPSSAATLNGTAGTFLELDEGHRPTGHPAIHVIPGALALGEHLHATGRDLVTAVALGYELPARIGAACQLRDGVHPHGHWGHVGGAVACGRLLGFDAKTLRTAMNIAATLPIGAAFRPCVDGATVRNAYTGMSGNISVLAAQLAASGFTGLTDGLAETFGRILGTDYDPSVLTRDLGQPFQITTNYFKFHACCAINHSVMDVVLAATGGRRLRPEDVRRVEALTTSRWEAIGQREPKNQLAAKFALPFAVASALVRGSTAVASFQQAAVDDPTIRQMVDRVEVGEDPAYTAQWPEHFPARVTVDLADGTRLEAATLDPRGSVENPAEPDDLTRKFLELTAGALQPDGAEHAWARLTSAAGVSDVNELTQALRAASR